MLSFLAFMNQSLGNTLTAKGGLGGRCVDLINVYIEICFGLPHVWLNAVDWQHVSLAGFTWVPNGPANYPRDGCIVVWGATPVHAIDSYGHIALAVDADDSFLLTMDQNWPTGAPVMIVEHDYIGVLGWHIPPPP